MPRRAKKSRHIEAAMLPREGRAGQKELGTIASDNAGSTDWLMRSLDTSCPTG